MYIKKEIYLLISYIIDFNSLIRSDNVILRILRDNNINNYNLFINIIL